MVKKKAQRRNIIFDGGKKMFDFVGRAMRLNYDYLMEFSQKKQKQEPKGKVITFESLKLTQALKV
ncbi:hypothetical protein C0583_03960 [Candidatus Parcubacteria bacterium]|nr:MAG: hypothetical protein C0583_03960 [Candidatus Parcubacteria bacterium]